MFPGPPQKGAVQLMPYSGKLDEQEVVLQLLNSKFCIPVLLYGLEACPFLKSDLSWTSLLFVFL